ncbi:guanylate kinase [Nicoliella spurrieriana]|uniref:Guanylate kinase n=1 Tax=Nicoliella spurrieriana TaxID=2925830 RepID=A0A976RR80_9LACO|nr:guanylate kinase [Nicoliella spurrieriana]UQS86304.1 guanylate kinase [Nicoliella spurrieriana]
MKKMVLVITGAAGSGKTTICKYICAKYHLPKVVTHTTRAPRQGEHDGIDYYFESDASFAQKHFLESVHYSGAQYGSSIEGLEAAWQTAPLACIVLDTKGALAYQRALSDQVLTIYLTVDVGKDSAAALRKRMEARGDDPEKIAKRMQSAENKRDQQIPQELMGHATIIKNNDLPTAHRDVDAFMATVIAKLKS